MPCMLIVIYLGSNILQICFEILQDKIILPCLHSICRQCILDYIQEKEKKGESGEW